MLIGAVSISVIIDLLGQIRNLPTAVIPAQAGIQTYRRINLSRKKASQDLRSGFPPAREWRDLINSCIDRFIQIQNQRDAETPDTHTIRSVEFTASRAWGALNIANMNGTIVRLRWTDRPYKWHASDGEEVLAVMDGEVDMRYQENGEEHIVRLTSGDTFYAGIDMGHIAHSCGEARILVIEKESSV